MQSPAFALDVCSQDVLREQPGSSFAINLVQRVTTMFTLQAETVAVAATTAEVLRGLGGHGMAPGSGIPSIASVGCDGNKKAPPVAGLEG